MARTQNGFVMSRKKLETKLKNDSTFSQFYNDLKNISESTFLYSGLPETIDPAFLEDILFRYGMAVFFEEPDIGVVCLPAVQAGGYDINGIPLNVRAFSGFTGFSRMLRHDTFSLEKTECVLIYNVNREFTSAIYRGTIGAYAERLSNDIRTEDINIYAQRTPVTVVVPDGQVETVVNAIDRYENFGKIIVGYKGLDVEAIKSLKTDAPFVANDVNEHRTKLWNEALSFMGVSNVSIYKKERVSTDEVARSMGGAIAHRNVRQNPREKAIADITKKWGKKYGFSASVAFNEALFDLDPAEDLRINRNLPGFNRDENNFETGENLT